MAVEGDVGWCGRGSHQFSPHYGTCILGKAASLGPGCQAFPCLVEHGQQRGGRGCCLWQRTGKYRGVRFIGIDEISRKKGHTYHTQVYDLDNKRLLWTAANRDKDSLRRFFEW